jgi:hypothetical protein
VKRDNEDFYTFLKEVDQACFADSKVFHRRDTGQCYEAVTSSKACLTMMPLFRLIRIAELVLYTLTKG